MIFQHFKKFKCRKSSLLIAIGILIFTIPFLGGMYKNYVENQKYQSYLEALNNTVTIEDEGAPLAANNYVTGDVLGRIKIPAISCDLILSEGAGKEEMKYGAGHVLGTAYPGQKGNCAIAAHRNDSFGTYFSRLGEVHMGDTVAFEFGTEKCAYRIYEIFVVTPDDVSVLEPVDDRSTVTLISCHPKGSNTHRLIVRGELIEK